MSKIDWQQIDTVLLDMDGTLLDLHFDNYFWNQLVPEQYAAANGIGLDSALTALQPMFDSNRGTLNWYCTDYWSEKLDLNIMALKHGIKELIAIRPQVKAFLQSLRDNGKRVLLISNAHGSVVELKMAETELSPYFDAIFDSHMFGAPKEHQAFWQALHAKHSFDKTRTVFFDDSEAVLLSAKEYGIGTIIAMRHPDSNKPARDIDGFIGIDHFDEVMPAAAES